MAGVDQCTIFQLFTDRLVSEESPDCFMLCGIKCLFDVHRCHPHVRLPLSASLGYEFVRHEVVPVVCSCFLILPGRHTGTDKHSENPVVQHRGERSIQSCVRPQIDV